MICISRLSTLSTLNQLNSIFDNFDPILVKERHFEFVLVPCWALVGRTCCFPRIPGADDKFEITSEGKLVPVSKPTKCLQAKKDKVEHRKETHDNKIALFYFTCRRRKLKQCPSAMAFEAWWPAQAARQSIAPARATENFQVMVSITRCAEEVRSCSFKIQSRLTVKWIQTTSPRFAASAHTGMC